MHEKRAVFIHNMYLILFFFCFSFTSCSTTREVLPDNGISTTQTRDSVSELGNKQADSAAASAALEERSRELAEQSAAITGGFSEVITTLENGAGYYSEFEQLCQQIRNQPAITVENTGGTETAAQ